jgi:mRNA interferase RelE/StbE
MAWTIDIPAPVNKTLAKLDPLARRRIINFLYDRVAQAENPRLLGRPLSGPLRGFWRYRVGDYRIVVEIIDTAMIVVVVGAGPRQNVYD